MQLALNRTIGLILAMVFAVPASLMSVSPAYADEYDGGNASVIDAPQVPTKVDPSIGDEGKPPSGPCSKPLPNSPVIICGYSPFSVVLPPLYSGAKNQNRGLRPREASNLPPENFITGQGASGFGGMPQRSYNWEDIGVNLTYARNYARDLALGGAEPVSFQPLDRNSVGVEAMYFSKGVYWRDTRFWTERMIYEERRVSVFVGYNEWIPPVIQPRKWVPPVRDRFGRLVRAGYWEPERTIRAGYWKKPTPKTVPVEYIVMDSTKRRQTGVSKTATCTYGTCTYTVKYLTFWPQWLARTVVFSGMPYYKTPETTEVWCQTELGPGKLYGPYDHGKRPLNSQIGYKKTDLDPQTTLRQWWTKPPDNLAKFTRKAPGGGFILLSRIGEQYETNKFNNRVFVRGNTAALNLVTTCIQDKPRYIADAAKQPCVVLEPSSPFFGRELPASHELCQAFVPGNYEKDLSESKEMKCIYTKRSWIGLPRITQGVAHDFSSFFSGGSAVVGVSPSSKPGYTPNTFIHCDRPISAKNNPERSKSPNAIDYPITKAFWACEGDRPEKGNRTWHPDRNYNFLTCGYTFACLVPGGDDRPVITDINSNTSTRSSSQVLASGAQTEISWQIPSAVAVYDRQGRLVDTVQPDQDKAWQQWRVLDGSTPWYSAKDPSDPSQPTFGSNIMNANPNSSPSILNGGKNGWDTPDIYVRGYKGTDIANNTRRIGDIVVREGELLPFALDTEYNATIPKDMVIFGRPITMNQPVRCTMPPAYLYFVSGRATG